MLPCIHANVSLHMGTRSQVLACKYAAKNLFSCIREPQASYMIHKTNMLVLQDFYKSFTSLYMIHKTNMLVLQDFYKSFTSLYIFYKKANKYYTRHAHTSPPLSPFFDRASIFGNESIICGCVHFCLERQLEW